MKHIKSLLIFSISLFLPLLLIDLIYATDFNKAQTSKSGVVDMFEVLPEYLQVNSTAENRDFHIKRNERAIGSGTQYYFYFEGGTLTVSMTTDGIFRIGNSTIGTSSGNASYPINLSGGTETAGILPESQGGFGTSTPKYVRQNDGSSTTQLATNITIAGVGTDTATMRTNGVDISPVEKSYLDGLTGNIQTQINTIGTSTPTANSIVRTNTGTTTIDAAWIPSTIILNNFTQITTRNYDDVNGTSTIKPTQIAIGTSTLQGALNAVGSATFSGTITAGGFSGNGAGLTGISASVAFSEVTGSATSAQLPSSFKLPVISTEQSEGLYNLSNLSKSSCLALWIECENAGTSTFADSSINNFAITATGGITGTSTTIDVNASAYFDGIDDKLQVSDSPLYDFGTSSFVIQMYIKPTSTNNSQALLGKSDPGGGTGWDIRYNGASQDISINGFNGWTENLRGSATVNSIHLFKLTGDGSNIKMYVDTIQVGTTTQGNISDTSNDLQMGIFASYGGSPYSGYIDSLIIKKGTIEPYTEYLAHSTTYRDINGVMLLRLEVPATATAEASYIFNNASTTVFGLGTNTAIVATTTAYSGWFDGAVRATAFNVASTEKIKENIKPIKIKPDLLDAEGLAKQNYIAGSKSAWIAANQESYETVVNETGTGTVTRIDTATMETDYNNQAELAWASDLNQDTYTENIQKTYEKGFWLLFDSITPKSWNPKDKPTLTRKGFVVETMPDVVKGDDKQSIDPMALIAYISVVQQTLKADTIFALSTLKELLTTGTVTQQKIDYCNDRLNVLNP